LRSALRVAATLAITCVGLLVACAPGPSPSASVAATAVGPASISPSANPTTSAGSVAVDPTLLSILPADVAGAPLQPAPETAAQIALDPSLSADVEAIAVALAVSAGSSASEDLVIASVVRLRPDVFDETFFRGWRDSYDVAACEPAGGLRGNGEAEIDGRQVFIGSCANGGFTYHLRYGEDVIVSLTSLGERRFGELVVNDLGE
jgi:hypothetical protein